jgi:hypothetical protein
LTLSVALLFKQRTATIIIPFLLITACDMSRMFLLYISYLEISPLNLVRAIQPSNIASGPIVILWLTVLAALSVPLVLIGGCKHEII